MTLSGIVLCKPQDIPPNLRQIPRDEILGEMAVTSSERLLDIKPHRFKKMLCPFHNFAQGWMWIAEYFEGG